MVYRRRCCFHYRVMKMNHLAIIKSTYEGKNSEDNLRALQSHLADDVEWIEAAGFPYAGSYTGFAAIAENVFARLAGEWQDYRVQIDGYVDSGNLVIAYGTYSGIYRATQKAMQARVAHVWTLADGKIKRFEQIVDSAMVLNAIH